MVKKKIKCPSCGVILEVPQKGDEPVRVIRCPNCSHALKVTFQQEKPKDDGETVYGGGAGAPLHTQEDEGHTVFASTKKTAQGMLRFKGQSYPLGMGLNTVGRKASHSDANVQIPTDDRHMSREHAFVNMTRIANGSLKAIISCCKDRITTIVGGQPLQVGDQVVLTNGVKVTLGNTILEYIEE
jgi:DNA-directed RNA polymerase subunit RPC12/RpoP